MVNMKYRILFVALTAMMAGDAFAQDPLFSQFYHSPVYLNPAFAGCGKNDFRACYSGRVQWMNLPTPFQYHTLSVDKYSADYNVSGGIIVNRFDEGFIKTTDLSATLAKNFGSDRFTEKEWFLNFAMQFGLGIKNADKSKYLFADQLTIYGPTGGGSQVEVFQNANKAYFDVSAGVIFTYGDIMIGAAGHHLSQPHNGLVGSATDSRLPRRYTLHFSYLKDGYANNEGAIIFKPTVIVGSQGESRSLMLGSLFDMPERQIEFGLWYRNNWNFSNNHSLVLGVNIKFGKEKNYYNSEGNTRYRAGVSYDAEINKPGIRYTSGSTELGVLYESPSGTCPKPSGGMGSGRFPWEFH